MAALRDAGPAALGVIVFLLIACWRLVLVHEFAIDLPYSDQWDSEAWTWFRPFQLHGINWPILFAPHNEHRIALYRLVSLVLFVGNDHQWDNLVSCTFNAIFVAGMCALAVRAVVRHVPSPERWTVAGTLLVACFLPCGFENLVIGFQAAFYFLIVLGALGVWLAASRPPGLRNTLWLGLIGYASLFSMASGVFVPLAMIFALGLRAWSTRQSWRAWLPAIAVLGSATLLGFYLLVPVPQHQKLHAHSIHEWFDAVARLGSWPLPDSWFSVAVFWLPSLLGGTLMIRKRAFDAPGITALALVAWTGAQIGSIAYGRGNDLASVTSRYTDVLAMSVLTNVYFCTRALRSAAGDGASIRRVIAVSAWLTLVASCYAYQGVIGFAGMSHFTEARDHQQDNVRRYLRGWNRAALVKAEPWDIPYTDARRLGMMLDDPTIRDILPPDVRLPLRIGAYSNGFSVNGMPGQVLRRQGQGAYGSYAPVSGNANTAEMKVDDLHTRFPYLSMPVVGDLGAPGMKIELRSADGHVTRRFAAAGGGGMSWTDAIAAVPARTFSLLARDDSADAWFAFAPPRGMGRLSMLVTRLLDVSLPLLLVAVGLAGFVLLSGWLWRYRFAVAEALPDASHRAGVQQGR